MAPVVVFSALMVTADTGGVLQGIVPMELGLSTWLLTIPMHLIVYTLKVMAFLSVALRINNYDEDTTYRFSYVFLLLSSSKSPIEGIRNK